MIAFPYHNKEQLKHLPDEVIIRLNIGKAFDELLLKDILEESKRVDEVRVQIFWRMMKKRVNVKKVKWNGRNNYKKSMRKVRKNKRRKFKREKKKRECVSVVWSMSERKYDVVKEAGEYRGCKLP